MGHSQFAVKGTGPTLWSHGTKQYGVFGDSVDGIRFCRFDRATKALEGTLNLATIAGNPLDLPMTPDVHETPTVAVTPNGVIYVAAKNRDLTTPPVNLVRTTAPAVDALSAANWENAASVLTGPGGAHFVYLSWSHFEDALVLIYRLRLDGAGTDNPGYERVFRHDGVAWTEVGDITRGAVGTENAFYRNQMFVEGPADPHPWRGHLFGAWDLEAVATHVDKFSYLYTDDAGTTWRNIAGQLLATPFGFGDPAADLADTGISFGDPTTDNLYSNGAAIDANGWPCGTYTDQGQQRQRIVRWNGTSWTVDTSLGTRPGGGQLLNIVRFKGDLWSFMRPLFTGDPTKVELRRVGAPNDLVRLGSPVGSGWYCHFDPVALHETGTVELLHINDDVPRVVTAGNHARAIAAA